MADLAAVMDESPGDDDRDLETLIIACAAGDKAALNTVYQRLGGRLYAMAHRIVGERGLAEDVVQETFVSIWRHAGTFSADRGHPLAWMTGIVRHKSLDALRRARRETPTEEATTGPIDQANQDISALDHVANRQTGARILTCLGFLDERARRCIQMAYYDGMTYEDVAFALNSPLGTVKSWIRRGLMKLRACLMERGIDG